VIATIEMKMEMVSHCPRRRLLSLVSRHPPALKEFKIVRNLVSGLRANFACNGWIAGQILQFQSNAATLLFPSTFCVLFLIQSMHPSNNFIKSSSDMLIVVSPLSTL
jgi:hypothetical protein